MRHEMLLPQPGRTLLIASLGVFAVRDVKCSLRALMQQTIMAMLGKKGGATSAASVLSAGRGSESEIQSEGESKHV